MVTSIRTSIPAVAALFLAGTALAQVEIKWSTVDGGGGKAGAGTVEVRASIGQPDAGKLVAGAVQVAGGFWPGPVQCYADCDQSGSLNINDFICFQTKFAIGDPYADCDQNGTRNINDFICFQTKFALGCS